jgi:phage shock protein PspC (stress-responsive transcriptional regulator)
MKSTIKVSISRSAFHLDSEAYEALCNYLNCLEKHFEGKEGGKEIVSDIEARIAELLSARIDAPDQVITPTMAEEVIGIMGRPDDMDDHAEYSAAPPLRWGKRLYRDVNNKMIGGVCSGLAAYFNIDVVFPRLFFAFIFIGYSIAGVSFGNCISLLVYLVLWIVIAPARSVREKI